MRAAPARKEWKFPARNRGMLLTRGRRRAMPPAKTLRGLGLGRGMCFLDVGCGPGYFAAPACGVVGKNGRVLACDTSPVMIADLRRCAKERGLANLVARRSGKSRIPYPAESADFTLIAFVLHGLADPRPLLEEARRATIPGGLVVAIEWHPKPMDMGPPLESRLAPHDLADALAAAGFTRARWRDFDGNTYFALAKS